MTNFPIEHVVGLFSLFPARLPEFQMAVLRRALCVSHQILLKLWLHVICFD